MIQNLSEARELAREFVSEVQQKNKVRYDSNKVNSPFSVGDKCLVFTPIRKKGLSPKLRPQFISPLIIKEINSPVNVMVESENGKLRENVHISRLKKYKDPIVEREPISQNVCEQTSSDPEEDISTSEMVNFKRKYNKRFRDLGVRKSNRAKRTPAKFGFEPTLETVKE